MVWCRKNGAAKPLWCPVSAKKGIGISDLLDMVLLVAEVSELKANPNRNAKGKVIESKLDKGRGPVATLLVQTGTRMWAISDCRYYTRVESCAMFDYKGHSLKTAGPSVPVEILGLNEVPEAGDDFIAVDNEKLAKQVADKRQKEKHQQEITRNTKVTLEDLFAQIKEGEIKELNIVLKADVQGSIEAIRQSLENWAMKKYALILSAQQWVVSVKLTLCWLQRPTL